MVLQKLFDRGKVSQVVSNNDFNRTYSSPIFSFSNSGTVAVGGFDLFDFESDNASTQKYLPFNVLTIHNNSQAQITIYPNQDTTKGIIISSGVTRIFTQDEIGFIRSLKYKNSDSANSISAGQISIEVTKNQLNTNSLITIFAKKLFKRDARTF